MKFKYSRIALAAVAIFTAVPSCDSGGGGATVDLTAVSDSLTPAELRANDTITYATTSGLPLVASVALSPPLGDINGISVRYEKTGKREFSLKGITTPEAALQAALDTALGPPSPLNSPLRTLLLRPLPNFTPAELTQIATILAPGGGAAQIEVDPSGTVLLITYEVHYFHRVDSTVQSKLDGTMSGVFNSTYTKYAIRFVHPSAIEAQRYRLFTTSHLLPIVDLGDLRTINNVQSGNFTMSLTNP